MPIPAGAGVIASVVHSPAAAHRQLGSPSSWVGLILLTGFLMVSSWRFWSGKEINLSNRHPIRWIVVFGIGVYALVVFSQVILFLFAIIYMFSGILRAAASPEVAGLARVAHPEFHPEAPLP